MTEGSQIFQRFSQTEEPPKVLEAEVVDDGPVREEDNYFRDTQQETPHKKQHGGTLKRVIKEIFGQFFTVEFWKDAARIIVQELFSTFLISFGNSVAFIGKQKRNERVGNAAMSSPGVSDKAFGGPSLTSISTAPRANVMDRFGFR